MAHLIRYPLPRQKPPGVGIAPSQIIVILGKHTTSQFLFRNDDGTEVTATDKNPKNIGIVMPRGEPFRLRFEIRNDSGETQNLTYKLQKRIEGGAWDSLFGATDAIRIRASGNVTDGQATTQQLGSISFVAGLIEEDSTIGVTNSAINLDPGETTEIEWSLDILSTATIGDLAEFRVVDSSDNPIDILIIPRLMVGDTTWINEEEFEDAGSPAAAFWNEETSGVNSTDQAHAGSQSRRFDGPGAEVGLIRSTIAPDGAYRKIRFWFYLDSAGTTASDGNLTLLGKFEAPTWFGADGIRLFIRRTSGNYFLSLNQGNTPDDDFQITIDNWHEVEYYVYRYAKKAELIIDTISRKILTDIDIDGSNASDITGASLSGFQDTAFKVYFDELKVADNPEITIAAGDTFEDSITLGLSFNESHIGQVDFEPAITFNFQFNQTVDAGASVWESAVTLGLSFNETHAATASIWENSITLGLQFNETHTAPASIWESAVTLGLQFNQTSDGEVTKEASITLGLSLSETHSAPGSIYEDSIAFDFQFNMSVGAGGSVWEPAIAFGFQFDYSSVAGLDFENAVTLGLQFDFTSDGEVTKEASITLGLSLNETHTAPASIYEDSITFGISLSEAHIGQVDFEPAITFGLQFDYSLIAQVDFEPAIIFGLQFDYSAIDELAARTFEESIILGLQFNQTINAAGSVWEPTIAFGFQFDYLAIADLIFEDSITLGLLFDYSAVDTLGLPPGVAGDLLPITEQATDEITLTESGGTLEPIEEAF